MTPWSFERLEKHLADRPVHVTVNNLVVELERKGASGSSGAKIHNYYKVLNELRFFVDFWGNPERKGKLMVITPAEKPWEHNETFSQFKTREFKPREQGHYQNLMENILAACNEHNQAV